MNNHSNSESNQQHKKVLLDVINYWESTTELYLQYMSTLQAGLLASVDDEDVFKESNLRFAERAGIKLGDRVLDAGCGVAGPSIDFAKNIEKLKIEAVTVSKTQAKIAQQFVEDAELEDIITVSWTDYHSLPYSDNYFNTVLFLESFGYTTDRKSLLKEIVRVLKPRGTLYIKDVFRPEHVNSDEAKELTDFNSTYVYRTPKVSSVLSDITSVGLRVLHQEDITRMMDRRHVLNSMFEGSPEDCKLTEFGKAHYRGFKHLPIFFYEIKAQKTN